jgi:tetrahydromethanopterin S-methyltransferase subunit B
MYERERAIMDRMDERIQHLESINADLLAALERFTSLCPSNDGLGGHAPMSAFYTAAALARPLIALAKKE